MVSIINYHADIVSRLMRGRYDVSYHACVSISSSTTRVKIEDDLG